MTILDRLHVPRPIGLSAMLLVLLIIAPVTFAHASPPDQTWLAGVYDDADFDDVICLILASTGLVDDHASVEGRADVVLLGAEIPPVDLSVMPFARGSSTPRAPPTF